MTSFWSRQNVYSRHFGLVRMYTHDIFDMQLLVGELLVHGGVEAADHEVTIVLVLHELLDPAELEPADPLTLQHARDHVLQELLILTADKREK